MNYSPNIFRVIKSRKMRWVGHVARTGDRSAYRVLVGRPEGRKYLEDLGVDGSIILKCILNKWVVAWTGLIWLCTETGDSFL
jgi:hypothetical protein